VNKILGFPYMLSSFARVYNQQYANLLVCLQVGVVHVCEATLKKRLVEFESTESGSLTTEEFDAKAKEIDLQIRVGLVSPQIEGKGMSEIMCEHKVMGAVHFAHGLCRGCYDEVHLPFLLILCSFKWYEIALLMHLVLVPT
jgi:hypothetical protein